MRFLNKLFYRFSYLFWLAGLLLPSLYLLAMTQLKDLFGSRKDPWVKMLFLFLLLQVIALLFAARFDFFSQDRFLAGLHNISVFGFVLIGYSGMSSPKIRAVVDKYAGEVFIAISMLVIVGTIISLFLQKAFFYDGLLSFISENKFTVVRFNRIENFLVEVFPRTRVMGVYSATTAMLLLSSFLIYMNAEWDKLRGPRGLWIHVLFVVLLFLTGSRIYILISLVMLFLWSLKGESLFQKMIKRLPFLLMLLVPILMGALLLRTGSNSTRELLYSESIQFWYHNSFLFGIGIKPFFTDLYNVLPYPMGSHSSLIGYFFKTGLLGGTIALGFYVFIVRNYLGKIRSWYKKSTVYNARYMYILTGATLLILSTLFEDIDSFEIVGLYFGYVLYLTKEIIQSEKDNNLLEIIRHKDAEKEVVFDNKLVTFLNPYSYLLARNEASIFKQMDTIYIDGISLVYLLRFFGVKAKRRSFDMTSVAPQLFDHCMKNNQSIYFIGAREEEVKKTVSIIQEEYQELIIAGFRDGYIKEEGMQAMEQILATNPDYVVVGMGTVLQENFLLSLREYGFSGGGFTCGGFLHQTAQGLDYYPRWADRYHLRWLYRILDEPKLLPRYLFKYPLSVVRLFQDWASQKANH